DAGARDRRGLPERRPAEQRGLLLDRQVRHERGELLPGARTRCRRTRGHPVIPVSTSFPHSNDPFETCRHVPPLNWMIFAQAVVRFVPTACSTCRPLLSQPCTLPSALISSARVSLPPSLVASSTNNRVADQA